MAKNKDSRKKGDSQGCFYRDTSCAVIWLYTNYIDDMKEESKWLDENLTTRERAKLSKENAIRIALALVFYIVIMWVLGRII